MGFIAIRQDRGMPIHTIALLLKRGLVGFVAGFIVAYFVLTLLGAPLRVHSSELSIFEIANQKRALRIATGVGLGLSLLMLIFGRIGVSRFWFWFAVAYGLTCVVPSYRYKGSHLLPFITPFLNFGVRRDDAWLVVAQFAIAAGIAALLHWGCTRWRLYPAQPPAGNAESVPIEPASTG
jgi:hypothetical protein